MIERTTKRILDGISNGRKGTYRVETTVVRSVESPITSAKLNLFHKDGFPKSTQKQTDWSLSVWSQWSCYCSENLVKVDECVHELKQEFTAMTEEALLFWLPKFVAEIRKSDGSL